MAQLRIEGDELVLDLTGWEKVEAVRGDQRVPLRSVRSVEVLDDAHAAADRIGLRVGTRIPRVVEVASVTGRTRFFAAVHRDTPRGVRVVLEGAPYDEWIVGCEDPEAVAAMLAPPG